MIRVLLVEDDASVRQSLTDILTDEGIQVETASDGVDGMDRLTSSDYDVVLLDLMMPRLNGQDVIALHRLTKNAHHPIIVITALHDAAAELRKQGVRAIDKPFEIADVIAAVRHACAPPDRAVSA